MVIVIIFTESTFELLDQLIPEIRTYLDSGVQQFCIVDGFFWEFYINPIGLSGTLPFSKDKLLLN